MQDIKFIKRITQNLKELKFTEVGNCMYCKLHNKNLAKMWCESSGVRVDIINICNGNIDSAYLPFNKYFAPTKCSPTAPEWYQHIDNNHWYFENEYSHVVPTDSDYKSMANGILAYIMLFQ